MRKLRILLPLTLAAVQLPLLAVQASAVPSCFGAGNTFERRSMRGHIDDDRGRDFVWVGARRIDGRCRYFVFARSSSAGVSWVRVPARDRFSRFSLRHDARPIAMVRIDTMPGREIAVKLLQGASVRPFGIFTMRAGSLRRMVIDAAAPPLAAEGMFAFGGGLALMFGTDCAYARAPRTVVFSRAFPSDAGPRYVVERRWFHVDGARFVRTEDPRQRVLVHLSNLRRRFPEFRNGGLLPRCAGKVFSARNA